MAINKYVLLLSREFVKNHKATYEFCFQKPIFYYRLIKFIVPGLLAIYSALF